MVPRDVRCDEEHDARGADVPHTSSVFLALVCLGPPFCLKTHDDDDDDDDDYSLLSFIR